MPKKKSTIVQKQKSNTQIIKGFYCDMSRENMLNAVILRSPCAAGIIEDIIPGELPEGYYFIDSKNFPGVNKITTMGIETEVLCSEKILYQNQALAIICGPEKSVLKEIVKQTKLKIKEQKPKIPELIYERKVTKGKKDAKEFEKLFKHSAHNIKNTWTYALSSHSTTETNGALCYMEKDRLTICTPTLWPKHLIKNISEIFNLPEDNIFIKKTNASSPHTNSLWKNAQIVAQTCAAAIVSGKPVKLELSREEHKSIFSKRGSVEITHRMAVMEDGEIRACEINIDFDAGIVNPFVGEIIDRLTIAASSLYDFKNLKINARAFSTNTAPTSTNIETMDLQSFFAIENQLQKICEVTGILPSEIRFKNSSILRGENAVLPFKLQIEKGKEAINAIIKASDFDRKFVSYRIDSSFAREKTVKYEPYNIPLRGIALSTAYDASGYYGSSIFECKQKMEVTLETDGSLTIHAISPSSSALEIWKNTASEILNIDPKLININTDFNYKEEPVTPENIYSNVSIMTELLKKCCLGIEAKRFREALPITVSKALTSAQLKQWDSAKFKGIPFHRTSFAASILELMVDPCSFKISIEKLYVVINAGKIFLSKEAETRVKLEIHRMLSQIIENEVLDCKNISVYFVQSESEPAQIGGLVKRILPAAFSAALSQAMNCEINSLPINENVLYDIVSSSLPEKQEGKTEA